MKKALLILFLMVICLSAESPIPSPSAGLLLAENIAESAPIFRKGKARQPRARKYDKPHPGFNVRRNMRIQRKNGIGSRVILDESRSAVILWEDALTSNQPEA